MKTLAPSTLALALILVACSHADDSTSSPSPSDSAAPADPNANGTGALVTGGPVIDCNASIDGTMISAAPGSSVAVGGTVTSPDGVATVTVNGDAATVTGGAFSATIPTRFGVNFADVTATDTHGVQSTRTCAFVVAQQWAPENQPLSDTVDVKLAQGAIDDKDRADLDSFGDIISNIASSPGLRDAISGGLTAAPFKPSSCDLWNCTPPLYPGGPNVCLGCTYSSQIDVYGLSLPGPQNVSLDLVDGGLVASVNVPSIGVNVGVHGNVGSVPYGFGGWIILSNLNVTMALDTSVSNGKLNASVRNGSVGVSVGAVNTSVPGLAGWIVDNVVVPLAQGPLRSFVAGQLSGFVTSSIGPAIGGTLAGFNLPAVGATFDVPSLTGSATPLAINFGISSLSTAPSGMRIGVSSAFSMPAKQSRPSLGIALPDGPVADAVPLTAPTTAGAALHVGVLNQALHALWRGGVFDASLSGAALGGGVLPENTAIRLETQLPPVAEIVGDSVELSLGGMNLDVAIPGLVGPSTSIPSLKVDIGARVSVKPTLQGNALKFDDLTLNDLHFATGNVAIGQAHAQSLTTVIKIIVQNMVLQSLNNALPVMPIPSFQMPADLKPFGLSGSIGLSNTSLTSSANHLQFGGQLSSQP